MMKTALCLPKQFRRTIGNPTKDFRENTRLSLLGHPLSKGNVGNDLENSPALGLIRRLSWILQMSRVVYIWLLMGRYSRKEFSKKKISEWSVCSLPPACASSSSFANMIQLGFWESLHWWRGMHCNLYVLVESKNEDFQYLLPLPSATVGK